MFLFLRCFRLSRNYNKQEQRFPCIFTDADVKFHTVISIRESSKDTHTQASNIIVSFPYFIQLSVLIVIFYSGCGYF